MIPTTPQPTVKHSKKVRLLLHLARMECQLTGQIKWANLSKDDRLTAKRSAKLLWECSQIIQRSIDCKHPSDPLNIDADDLV